jgi:hypothetical protein
MRNYCYSSGVATRRGQRQPLTLKERMGQFAGVQRSLPFYLSEMSGRSNGRITSYTPIHAASVKGYN